MLTSLMLVAASFNGAVGAEVSNGLDETDEADDADEIDDAVELELELEGLEPRLYCSSKSILADGAVRTLRPTLNGDQLPDASLP